jgi:transaldolase
MQLFVDTAKLSEIREAMGWGVVDGITTNPSLLRAAMEGEGSKSLEEHVREICRLAGKGRPVSLEVMGLKAEEMVEEARILHRKFNPVARNVVIKIPVCTSAGEGGEEEGIKALRELARLRIPTNATLVMTPEQALLAAKAGARYVSPFAGRIDDLVRSRLGIPFGKHDYFDFSLLRRLSERRLEEAAGKGGGLGELYQDAEVRALADPGGNQGILSGVELVRSTVKILRYYRFRTKVIASSLRHPRQVREVAEAGADVATVPFQVLRAMLRHPKTEEGVRLFTQDAEKAGYRELFG